MGRLGAGSGGVAGGSAEPGGGVAASAVPSLSTAPQVDPSGGEFVAGFAASESGVGFDPSGTWPLAGFGSPGSGVGFVAGFDPTSDTDWS